MTEYTLSAITGVIAFINFVLHVLGCHVLVLLARRAGTPTTQQVFLINLSFSEAAKSVGYIIVTVVTHTASDTANKYVKVTNDIITVYSSYVAMFFLTGDRMFATVLHLRYRVYWSVKRTVILIVVSWTTLIVFAVVFTVTYKFTQFSDDAFLILSTYAFMLFDCSYFVFAIIAYSVMFNRYITSHRQTANDVTQRPSAFTLFYKSRFYIPVLLITSFLALSVIPNMIYMFLYVGGRQSPELLIYVLISKTLADTLDAIIYLFLKDTTRNVALQKLGCAKCTATEPTNAHEMQARLREK